MNRPVASVVVCCYNRGDRVSSCLESLVESTYPELELVLVDDGSTDDTAGVLERFRAAHTDTPVTIVSTEANLGVSAARNAGVDAACGELVFFTDSDCEVEPDWLERLVEAFGSGEVDAVAGRVLNPTAKNLAEMACFGRSGVRGRRLVGGNMGFRREVLLRYRFDEALRYGCDEESWPGACRCRDAVFNMSRRRVCCTVILWICGGTWISPFGRGGVRLRTGTNVVCSWVGTWSVRSWPSGRCRWSWPEDGG